MQLSYIKHAKSNKYKVIDDVKQEYHIYFTWKYDYV